MFKYLKECPVCKSAFISLAKQIPTERAGDIDLFYCMECESFCSPFAPEHLNGPTLNHHLKVFERNQEFTYRWLQNIKDHINPRKILDIGCGIGSLLNAANRQGINGIGFDVDAEAAEYGRTNFGLNLKGEVWSSAYDAEGVDLITCIMVLEHIKWPRPLFRELILGARKYNSMVYISVPWFNRSEWKHLLAPNDADSLLNAPYVHVTHFSDIGFIKLCNDLGVKSYYKISSAPWAGFLIEP